MARKITKALMLLDGKQYIDPIETFPPETIEYVKIFKDPVAISPSAEKGKMK